MNDDVRAQFVQQAGFDPIELFRRAKMRRPGRRFWISAAV